MRYSLDPEGNMHIHSIDLSDLHLPDNVMDNVVKSIIETRINDNVRMTNLEKLQHASADDLAEVASEVFAKICSHCPIGKFCDITPEPRDCKGVWIAWLHSEVPLT